MLIHCLLLVPVHPPPPVCRWTQTASNLQDLYDKLIGDVLISSGVIAYLGAFTSAFRGEVVQEWTHKCKVGPGAGGGADGREWTHMFHGGAKEGLGEGLVGGAGGREWTHMYHGGAKEGLGVGLVGGVGGRG